MALFFTITLALSILGLTTLITLKRYEMRTGRVVFARSRPYIQRVLHALVLFIQYILPFLARRSMHAVVRSARPSISAFIARVTLSIEHTLASVLRSIQGAMQPKGTSGPASSFLQEVAEHKRRLLRDPDQKHAIFEEYQQQ